MEAGHQTSLKVPNGGTMSGALPDGREREGRERKRWREGQRGRGALTTNILFLAERMSRVWERVARLGTENSRFSNGIHLKAN